MELEITVFSELGQTQNKKLFIFSHWQNLSANMFCVYERQEPTDHVRETMWKRNDESGVMKHDITTEGKTTERRKGEGNIGRMRGQGHHQ